MSTPLDNNQKRNLAQLARRAFNFEGAKARGRGEAWDVSSAAGEAWRHAQVEQACGKLGLRCCSQDDYAGVTAHFLALLGQTGQAMNWHVKAQSNPRRQIEWKIVEILREMGKHMPYADAICVRMSRGTHLLDASDRQLWNVFYALRTEFLKRKKQTLNQQEAA